MECVASQSIPAESCSLASSDGIQVRSLKFTIICPSKQTIVRTGCGAAGLPGCRRRVPLLALRVSERAKLWVGYCLMQGWR